MSLSTRIAIGPSRCLAFAEAAMIAGAIIATATTMAARLLADATPGVLWPVAAAAALVGVALAARRWSQRVRARVYEVFIGERAGFTVRRLGDDTAPQPFALTDSAMVWPRFVVLSLSPIAASAVRTGLRNRLDIAMMRGEMLAGDAWRLHRFMIWAQRGGRRAGSIGKDPLG